MTLKRMGSFVALSLSMLAGSVAEAQQDRVTYKGEPGPGNGVHIVFVTGDEEYRSEEAMPQLAKILAVRHGFKCTVLFAIDPASGQIDPDRRDNIPGLEALDDADLLVLFTRKRNLPPTQMAPIVRYIEGGGPVIGVRTATHAFLFPADSPFAGWNTRRKDGGFGRRVLGADWLSHYGAKRRESTRGSVVPRAASHPITRGVGTIWGDSDVYGVRPLPDDAEVLVLGQPLTGMSPTDGPNTKKAPVPVAWTRSRESSPGRRSRVFTTTMGSSTDFRDESLRRLFVNACYWCVGLEKKIPSRADVALVGGYAPNPRGFGGFVRHTTPNDHALPGDPSMLSLSTRSRKGTKGKEKIRREQVRWDPRKTALVICDMWDDHWCRSATKRVGELAGAMNMVVAAARARGVMIIHAPSSVVSFYDDTPQRRLARDAPYAKSPVPLSKSERWGTTWCWPDPEREPGMPVDDSDMGCDCKTKCEIREAWKRQIAAIEIAAGDAITDHGQETFNLLQHRGINNVILMGVHLNMCVLGRPFGIRQMVGVGKNVVLMRDMTDTMYDPRQRPRVTHFEGTDLVVEHVERHWCPTVTSVDLVGGAPFRFAADHRR